MKKIAALMVSLIIVLSTIHAQRKLKIYYDKDWLVVESKKNATYYREVTRKSKTDPGGKVKDFFITGELQGEGDAILLDLKNDANSQWKGKLIGYFQDGKKRFENNYDIAGLPEGAHTQWYVDGVKESELHYKAGKLDGWSVSYFANGKEKTRVEYMAGDIKGPVITCDEQGNCERILREDFRSGDDTRGWNLKMTSDDETEILAAQGLRMEKKSNKNHHRAVSWNLDMTKNFKIEASVLFSTGDFKNGFGIVFAYKEPKNMQFFYINADGKFKVGAVTNNKTKATAWKSSEFIKKGMEANELKIVCSGNNLEFFVNEGAVHQSDFNPGSGTLAGIGLEEGTGKMQAYLLYMVVSNSIP